MNNADMKGVYNLVTAMEHDFTDLRDGLLAVSCIAEYARLESDCLKDPGKLGHALDWISQRLMGEAETLRSKWEAANVASHKLAYPDTHRG